MMAFYTCLYRAKVPMELLQAATDRFLEDFLARQSLPDNVVDFGAGPPSREPPNVVQVIEPDET
jgi:hypothetical protein